ncbi:hypothetical protein KCU91_g10259, partial [Aureobasidium melanogenum]
MAAFQDNNHAKDVEVVWDDVREDLHQYLDDIKGTGRFATMRRLDQIVDRQVRLLGIDDTPGHDYLRTESRSLLPGELGVKGDGIHAELYKMLLYEKGAMFKRHADSEKAPGMFGTLVISLPSAYWGGAVVVSHNGQRCLLQTHKHEYLACYSDVLHEVQEVTSGYRWVLTYNLVQTEFEHLNSTASAEQKFRGIFTEWNKINKNGSGEADRIIYQLDHKYTDASIRLQTLKGSDLLKSQLLFSVGNQMGYALYLASLEKQVHYSAESGYHGYRSRYDDEEEGGSHGEVHAIEDVLEESLTLTRVVDPDGLVVITDLAIEEEDILQEEPYEDCDPDEHEYYISETITVCAEFGLTDMLPGLSSAVKDSLSESALRSLSDLKYSMNLRLLEDRTRLETILKNVVLGCKSVSKNYDTLSFLLGAEALDVQNKEDCMPELKARVTEMLAAMFSNLDSLTSEYGDVIARIATSDTGRSLLRDRIPCQMFERSESLSENFLSIYRPLVKIAATNFSFRKPKPLQTRPTSTYGAYGAYSANRIQQITRKPALDGQVLANVLGHVMGSQLNEYGQLLIARVRAETAIMDPEDYEHMILPFLKGITMRLIDGKDEIATYEDLFQTCLSQYIFRLLGLEPVQINWSRNSVRCNCRDCMDLNAFLRSPVDHVKQIRVSKQRRHHLHTQLDAYTYCTHITERGCIETMVFTKQCKSFEEKLRTWGSKAKSALAALHSLEDQEGTSSSPSQLRKLLGDRYVEIMALRIVRIMTAAQQQPNQSTQAVVVLSGASNAATAGASTSTATQSDIPQIAGRKREAVVIDLTDD